MIKSDPGSLPQVEVEKRTVAATAFDELRTFYTFENVPFAAPPLGQQRFRPPEPLQSLVAESKQAGLGNPPVQAVPKWAGGLPAGLNSGNEDCLYLDMKVPKAAFDRRSDGTGVPVLVWIYGGGYTAGSKDIFGSGAGLLSNAAEDIIYVALNYRLGIFGFLGGSQYVADGGTPNIGLLDQRFALEWISSNIAFFGGNPDKITVIGESAGAGSIFHQIVAYGGHGRAPFAQAILQSPGFYPITSDERMNRDYQSVLRHANCKTLTELRGLSEEQLRAVNQAVIDEAPFGQFLLGPVVDGSFVPDLPGRLLSSGSFHKNIKLMLGQCYNEGHNYAEPVDMDDEYILRFLDRAFPTSSAEIKRHIIKDLYPAAVLGSLDNAQDVSPTPHYSRETPYYDTSTARVQRLISDAIYIQHNNALSHAFNNETYNYLMSISPGVHGTDLPYTFYEEGPDGEPVEGPLPLPIKVKSKQLAKTFQTYVTNFVISGNPNVAIDGNVRSDSLPEMKLGGKKRVILEFSNEGIREVGDPSHKEQCVWWQQGYFA